MIGDLDENKAQDINRAYRNIWRVVRANGGSFLIPHHAGWNTERERGSSAIRGKSDIVAQITEFDPTAGVIELKHNKRRGGRKLKQFTFEVKLIPVDGYPQPIPIVTGTRLDAGQIAADEPPEYAHAAKIVEIMVRCFPNGAKTEQLNKQFQEEAGLKRQTFYKAFNCALAKGWITGKGPYNLNPNRSWMKVVQKLVVGSVHSVPLKGGQRKWTSPMDIDWSNGQRESCKSSDTTTSDKKPNAINVATPGMVGDESGLLGDGGSDEHGDHLGTGHQAHQAAHDTA